MRFDDILETVLAADRGTPHGRQSVWRQLVDLIGRRRAAPDARAMALLWNIAADIPLPIRAASARTLEFADPPEPLVRLFALDEISVGLPVLRSARLASSEWVRLLPDLAPAARGVLRNRRDLGPAVRRALEAFGSTDFVLPASPAIAAASTGAGAGEDLSFVALADATALDEGDSGTAAASVATEAADVEPPANDAANPMGEREADSGGIFAISEVVARIDAFRRRREEGLAAAPRPAAPAQEFRFETDAMGVIRWVDGIARAAAVGISLAIAGIPGTAGVDGVAQGAFRRRAAFSNARLVIESASDAAGDWLLSAVPAFDPANGRFTGYRGSARRPRIDERAEPARRAGALPPDSLRQLVHELRTPTNAIAGFAEMIATEMLGPVPDPYREYAEEILAQARELLGAVDDLDLAARIDSAALALVPARVALHPLLTSIAADLAPLASLRGSQLVVPEDDIVIAGDRRAVERLFARLLATLVSASAKGERISIQVTVEKGEMAVIAIDRPRALADYPGETVLGIDDEHNDTTLLGTGFALRLARNLARELGGALVIGPESLTLRLPASVNGQVDQAHLS